MTQPNDPPQTPAMLPPIASPWHTALVLLLLAATSASGALHFRLIHDGPYAHAIVYLITAAWEWLLLGCVALGLHRRGIRLRDLIGQPWSGIGAIARDLLIAIVFLLVCGMVMALLTLLLHPEMNPAMVAILPRSPLDLSAFFIVCLTAGICEELIFRGYLQKQLTALTHSAPLGLLLQGFIFGASHGYQGPKRMFIIAVFGCFFGRLARLRRSLRPGILAHILQDTVAGIAAFYLMK